MINNILACEAKNNAIYMSAIRSLSMATVKNSVDEGEEVKTEQVATSGPTNATKTYTPAQRKFRPKIKKEEVAATNKTSASVQKLSAWLSNDPFEQKKIRPKVRGRNILTKARAFEPDQPSPVASDIQDKVKGGVSNRKKWIEGGYSIDVEEPVTKEKEFANVSERAKWLREEAFQKKNSDGIVNVVDSSTEHGSQEQNSFHFEDVLDEPCDSSQGIAVVEDGNGSKIQRPINSNINHVESHSIINSPRNGSVSVSDRARWLKEEAFKNNKL